MGESMLVLNAYYAQMITIGMHSITRRQGLELEQRCPGRTHCKGACEEQGGQGGPGQQELWASPRNRAKRVERGGSLFLKWGGAQTGQLESAMLPHLLLGRAGWGWACIRGGSEGLGGGSEGL